MSRITEIWINKNNTYFKIGEVSDSGKEDYSKSKVVNIITEDAVIAVVFENKTVRIFSGFTYEAKGVV